VQFYSTSCGHCRKFAPVYAELASKLVDDPEIVIAQIDGTANDVPGFVPEGFPTILFFPKANKKGVEYDGSRDLHDLEQFIADVRAGREHIGGLPEQEEEDADSEGAKVEL
jgi:thiol-disulfide isomerase/thioredoxin